MSERPEEKATPDTLIGSGNTPQQPTQPTPAYTNQHEYLPPPPPPPLPSSSSVAATPTSTSPQLHRRPTGHGRAMELPPLPQALSATGGSFSPASRSAGVSSILNPVDPDEGGHGLRRKVSELDSPTSSLPTLPSLGTTLQRHQGPSATNAPVSMDFGGGLMGERAHRRILTPRSPSLHRAVSLNQLNAPAATYSAQHSPFAVSPRNRAYMIEPGTLGAPPLPTPPTAMRQSYGFPAPKPPTQAARRASFGTTRGVRPPSESASPRSSYSSYSQAGQASPAGYGVTGSMSTLAAPDAAGSDPIMSGHGTASAPTSIGPERQRAVGVPMSSSGGQNVYQMMTLETTSGTVQLPVDVQAASRVADEKRRRNAGASARFRQRRKEKERESSTTISRMEQQLKALSEDVEHYKHERDYYAGVVMQMPGGERHFQRPASPRLRRSTSYAAIGGPGFTSMHEAGGASPDEGRNVRRRTSTLSLPPPTQAQTPMPAHAYLPTYTQQNYGQPLAPQPQLVQPGGGPLPSPVVSRDPLTALPPGAPQSRQAAPQTGPWNPYSDRRPSGPPHQGREFR